MENMTNTNSVQENQNPEVIKTAVVAIIGRPSAGESTFLNTACQEPVVLFLQFHRQQETPSKEL